MQRFKSNLIVSVCFIFAFLTGDVISQEFQCGFNTQTMDIGFESNSLAAGDLNGDECCDLVVTRNDELVVFLNEGNGELIESGSFASVFLNVIKIADLDGDFDLDLVGGSNDGIELFFNNGTGEFPSSVHYDVPIGVGGETIQIHQLELADFDCDQDVDVAAQLQFNSIVRFMANNGNGVLSASTLVGVGGGLSQGIISAGDLNGDSKMDLIFVDANENNSSICFRANDGDGTFGPLETISAPIGVWVNQSVDLDGDSDMDLVAMNKLPGGVGISFRPVVDVFINNGGGSFAKSVRYDVDQFRPDAMALADFDGDQDVDIVTVDEFRVSLLLNIGNGTFSPTESFFTLTNATRSQFVDVVSADWDKDGDSDLLSAYNADPNGSFSIFESRCFFVGDIDGNGTVDLLDVLPFVEAVGSGEFQVEADVNKDGNVDLLDVQPFVQLIIGS